MTSFFSRRRRILSNLVAWSAALAVATMRIAAASEAAAPAEARQVLAVPASPVELHVAATLPNGLELSGPLRLVEVGRPGVVIPAQLAPSMASDGSASAKADRLIASVAPRRGEAAVRRFRLETGQRAKDERPGGFRFQPLNSNSLVLWDGDERVLAYNHGVITNEKVPPDDHRRSRACYVHPLWGLHGEVLTDDFPRDHYHHHGVFWTWPHVRIDEEQHDLWAGATIHDRFVSWLGRETGPAAAVLAVENGWFVGDRKVMIERVWLRAYKRSDNERTLDFEFVWIPTDRPVTLWGAEGKSYGGLTIRFAPFKDRPVITVPSGRTTEDLKETPLEWADFTAQFLDAPVPSGAAVFIDPAHPDYPPTWLTRHYGCLCVGWPGVKSETFKPGEPFRLNYRVWIHKTDVELSDLQQAYEGYAAAARAGWE